jgi:hypothetical protein
MALFPLSLWTGRDQSAVQELANRNETVRNWSAFGAFLADLIVYKGFD